MLATRDFIVRRYPNGVRTVHVLGEDAYLHPSPVAAFFRSADLLDFLARELAPAGGAPS